MPDFRGERQDRRRADDKKKPKALDGVKPPKPPKHQPRKPPERQGANLQRFAKDFSNGLNSLNAAISRLSKLPQTSSAPAASPAPKDPQRVEREIHKTERTVERIPQASPPSRPQHQRPVARPAKDNDVDALIKVAKSKKSARLPFVPRETREKADRVIAQLQRSASKPAASQPPKRENRQPPSPPDRGAAKVDRPSFPSTPQRSSKPDFPKQAPRQSSPPQSGGEFASRPSTPPRSGGEFAFRRDRPPKSGGEFVGTKSTAKELYAPARLIEGKAKDTPPKPPSRDQQRRSRALTEPEARKLEREIPRLQTQGAAPGPVIVEHDETAVNVAYREGSKESAGAERAPQISNVGAQQLPVTQGAASRDAAAAGRRSTPSNPTPVAAAAPASRQWSATGMMESEAQAAPAEMTAARGARPANRQNTTAQSNDMTIKGELTIQGMDNNGAALGELNARIVKLEGDMNG